jgi:hypothetical protein
MIEEVGDVAPGGIVFDASEQGQYFNFADHDVTNYNGIDERTLYYDWLADSATTSHIVNRRDVFKTYESIHNTPITGVGGLRVHAEGRGDVDVYTTIDGKTHTIHMRNVLYVPGNRNNLFSLGRWLAKGGDFSGQSLTLISNKGIPISKGTLTANNLIKLRLQFTKIDADLPHADTSYPASEKLKTWDVWHCRFAHVGISGLRKLFDKQLVTGLFVDRESTFSDCSACTEAKQSVMPFNKTADHDTKPGELTHVDVWGKYPVSSINGCQYYILLVDDASRYVTVEFMKTKDQATLKVKNYITHLEVHGKMPKAIHINRGHEFVNKTLLEWLYSKGMDVQMTAPHSPSQNGVAERMNRTLEELARAMRLAADLPVFLWEQAVSHAAYVRNRAYNSAIKTSTPYERWYGRKPDVSHLREFGAPVWILLQGQKIQPKMEAKSKRRALVGYDDGSRSVKYYNAETRSILTSRNFRFLEPSDTVPEQVLIIPDDVAREGETMGGARNTVDARNAEPGPSNPKKRPAEDESEESLKRQTRGKRVDYKRLDDPFTEDEAMSVEQLTNLLEGDEDQPTLKQAK